MLLPSDVARGNGNIITCRPSDSLFFEGLDINQHMTLCRLTPYVKIKCVSGA